MMRRTAFVIMVLALLLLSSCSSRFTFLSVRMRGNGDGSITAVVQKEFSLGGDISPVTLTVYYGQEYSTKTDDMRPLASDTAEKLATFEDFEVVVPAVSGYYFAVASYTVNGEILFLQSETINYDDGGNRIQQN